MSAEFTNERFPKSALYAAGALILVSIATVGSIRLGLLPAPETAPESRMRRHVQPTVTRDFRFEDRADGALLVTDVAANKLVFIFPPGSNTGFIRGVMRGLMRERRLHEVARTGPVTVAQWADGALTLTDQSTGRIIELGSFGHTNRAAFAQLLVPYAPGGPGVPDQPIVGKTPAAATMPFLAGEG
ncbi:photosynthetic complex assembly protein PuhC [Sandarakinorhabdus oryzae]|uniref:photosynthetic complex assembly protein PuhC n=1 Tax=Sandarakinorhabdus oryzae TaxID=2675220 RepID=UPI0012E104A7|nr:photosynthetic complex assembly protein PuhC [Sandarakinorhabdus oryzae]